MKKMAALSLVALALLVTGCPRNQYVIDLTPRGKVIERTLLFYREDVTDTNGATLYHEFPQAELAAITKLYPAGGVTHDGARHSATGEFAVSLPPDVGGAGSYTNLATTLGNAGFYVERFRGDDDVATVTAKRLQAADQLADLVIGWSRMELRREEGYEKLRQFLDVDFRRDVKNLSLYGAMWQTSLATRAEAPEEFPVRFGQYLMERGYLKVEDLPKLFRMGVSDNDSRALSGMMQRWVAAKLGVPQSGPMPRSLAFLADPVQVSKSWEKYLSTTELYRARVRQWEKERIVWGIRSVWRHVRGPDDAGNRTNSAAASTAAPAKPMPSVVEDELTKELLNIDFFSDTDDHVTVRMSLPRAPSHSNGKWDPSRKQEVWESEIEPEAKVGRVPAFCYANWSEPDEAAQKRYFGKVVLSGDDLSQYCLWRDGLDGKQAADWEAWLAALQPGQGLKEKIEAFRFAGEPVSHPSNGQPQSVDPSDFPRQLFGSALEAAERQSTGTNSKP
jgi:hypothetical protein